MTKILPLDKGFFESYFGVDNIPDEVRVEYGIRIRLYHGAGGGSGPYGVHGCINILRELGYGELIIETPTVFDWKDYFGKRVIAKYGSEDVTGTLLRYGTEGRLVVDLDEGIRVTELPAYYVKPVPEEKLENPKSDWERLKEEARRLGVSVKWKKKDELAAEVNSLSQNGTEA